MATGPDAADLVIAEEIWENQRYKLMGWSRPFPMDGGFQSFSDRLGQTVYSKDAFPALTAPEGWAWAAPEWELDREWADVDADGWCYGASFAAIREQLLANAVSPQKSATDFVRRRRWTRARRCEASDAREAWNGYAAHLGRWAGAEQQRLRRREQCFDGIKAFEEQRRAATTQAFRRADHELLAQGGKLADTFDALLSLKVLLKRRADIDRTHADQLHAYLTRFAVLKRATSEASPRSDAAAVAERDAAASHTGPAKPSPQPALGRRKAIAALASAIAKPLFSVTEEVTDYALELHQGFAAPTEAPGVGSTATFRALWDRMGGEAILEPQWRAVQAEQAAVLDAEALVHRADHLVNELADAMQGCADLRRQLRTRLLARQDDCENAFRAVVQVYDGLCLDGAKHLQRLRSAAEDPAQHGASTAPLRGAKSPEKSDLWMAENTYRTVAEASLAACLSLAKVLPKMLLRVAELAGTAEFLIEAGGRQLHKRQLRLHEDIVRGFADDGEPSAENAGNAETAGEAATPKPDEEPEARERTRLETLLKEAGDQAAAFSAEAIEAQLPSLVPSELVVRAATAQRITLGGPEGIFSGRREPAKPDAATAAAEASGAVPAAEERSEGGDALGTAESEPEASLDEATEVATDEATDAESSGSIALPAGAEAAGATKTAAAAASGPPGAPLSSPQAEGRTLVRQPVLLILSLDGFLHIFDAERESFDPARIASAGPALSLDVRPETSGVEAVPSGLTPGALRVRGALQRSLMRLSAGGLFDVVLAEWSANLGAGLTASEPGEEAADAWQHAILHPLQSFGLEAAPVVRPAGPTVEHSPKTVTPATPPSDFLRSLVPQLRVEAESSDEDEEEIHVTFANEDGDIVDGSLSPRATTGGALPPAGSAADEKEDAVAVLEAAGLGADSSLAAMLGATEMTSGETPEKKTPRRKLTPTGSASTGAVSGLDILLDADTSTPAQAETQAEAGAEPEPEQETEAGVEAGVEADPVAEAEAAGETGGYEDEAEPELEVGASEETATESASRVAAEAE